MGGRGEGEKIILTLGNRIVAFCKESACNSKKIVASGWAPGGGRSHVAAQRRSSPARRSAPRWLDPWAIARCRPSYALHGVDQAIRYSVSTKHSSYTLHGVDQAMLYTVSTKLYVTRCRPSYALLVASGGDRAKGDACSANDNTRLGTHSLNQIPVKCESEEHSSQ